MEDIIAWYETMSTLPAVIRHRVCGEWNINAGHETMSTCPCGEMLEGP